MKRLLACLAVALCGGEAVAQLQVVEVNDFEGCKEFRVTNPTDRHFTITIDYQYIRGWDFQGVERDWNWSTNGTVPPRSTIVITKMAVPMIDCRKGYSGFRFQPRVTDITAQREEIDASREQVIRNYLEAEEAKKRQAEEYARQQQAEADARARRAAEQQAAREAAAKRAAQTGQAQADYEWDTARQIVAAGDPRCRSLVSHAGTPQEYIKDHQTCERNVLKSGPPERRFEVSAIDPYTCAFPTITHYNGGTREEAEALKRQAQVDVDECLRKRDGVQAAAAPAFARPDPAVLEAERLRVERAEAQRQWEMETAERQRQLDAQAAALEAERLAMIRQNAQQSMAQSTNDLRGANADFRQQSQSLQQSNAELEAWLNGE